MIRSGEQAPLADDRNKEQISVQTWEILCRCSSARLVAKGYLQKTGVDYEETFSSAVKHDSLRAVLAVFGAKYLEMVQLDVKTAFLNGYIKEEIYMKQPTESTQSIEVTSVISTNYYTF